MSAAHVTRSALVLGALAHLSGSEQVGADSVLSHQQLGARFSLAIGARSALNFVEELFAVRLPKFAIFSVVIAFGLVGMRILPLFVDEIARRFGVPRHYRALVSYLLHIGIFVFAFWLALAAVGIDFFKIVLSFGVISIVLSVGLSGIIGNVFSGVMIQVNDTVQRGSDVTINGVRGTVIEMSVSTVLLRLHDDPDDIVFVPNAHFTQSSVRRHIGDNKITELASARLRAWQVAGSSATTATPGAKFD